MNSTEYVQQLSCYGFMHVQLAAVRHDFVTMTNRSVRLLGISSFSFFVLFLRQTSEQNKAEAVTVQVGVSVLLG